MDEHQVVAFAYDLRVHSGDDGFRDRDFAPALASNRHDRFIQNILLLVAMNVAAHR